MITALYDNFSLFQVEVCGECACVTLTLVVGSLSPSEAIEDPTPDAAVCAESNCIHISATRELMAFLRRSSYVLCKYTDNCDCQLLQSALAETADALPQPRSARLAPSGCGDTHATFGTICKRGMRHTRNG